MNILNPNTIKFEQSGTGFLTMTDGTGATYANVWCARMFPLSDPLHYISVQHRKEKEYEEIGVIRSLDELNREQREQVLADIGFRYFVPEITDIRKITSRQGLDTWEADTDKGPRTFLVRDRKENVHMADNGTVFITDSDKCRYRIDDYTKLKPKAKAMLERMLL